jgi:nucleotide-binding universal stress UspA family protein
MEKILLAIDAKNLDMQALDFACYIGRLTNSKVTGVFLENLIADEKPVLKGVQGSAYLDWEIDTTTPEFIDKQNATEKNIAFFREACEKRSVRCSIHRDRGVPATEIIDESRYADLIIIDAATSFNRRFEGTPTEFVKDVLKDAECPVIIAPESFDSIDEIIFTYNGTRSSAFAMKQFTYLFPELSDKRAIVLQVNDEGTWADPGKYNIREWMQNHYSAIGFQALEGDTEDKLFDYMFKRKNVFLVMGAYGRSAVSRFFKHSHADLLIKTITQPIFIAHY